MYNDRKFLMLLYELYCEMISETPDVFYNMAIVQLPLIYKTMKCLYRQLRNSTLTDILTSEKQRDIYRMLVSEYMSLKDKFQRKIYLEFELHPERIEIYFEKGTPCRNYECQTYYLSFDSNSHLLITRLSDL